MNEKVKITFFNQKMPIFFERSLKGSPKLRFLFLNCIYLFIDFCSFKMQ